MGHDNNTADAPADAHELLTAADRAVIEAAAEADWFRAAPVSEAFRAQFSPDFLSFVFIPSQARQRLVQLFGTSSNTFALIAADWACAFAADALYLHDERSVSFATHVPLANGHAVEVSIAKSKRPDGLPWYLSYVPQVERLRLRRDVARQDAATVPSVPLTTAVSSPVLGAAHAVPTDALTGDVPTEAAASDTVASGQIAEVASTAKPVTRATSEGTFADSLPPVRPEALEAMRASEDYQLGPVPEALWSEVASAGGIFTDLVWVSQRWTEKLRSAAKAPIDVYALLNRDWAEALRTHTVRSYEGKLLFPVSILRSDGTTLVEVALKRDRAPEKPGSKPWFVCYVDDFAKQRVVAGHALTDWAYLGNMTELLDTLATIALPERWSFDDEQNEHARPILRSYLTYTFYRLQAEGKVLENREQGIAAFNTGLVDRTYEPLYACFSPSSLGEQWRFEAFCKAGSRQWGKKLVATFNPLPRRPQYFKRKEDLLFDTDRELRRDVDHILLDNINRLPRDFLLEEMRTSAEAPAVIGRAYTSQDPGERILAFDELREIIEDDPRIKRRLINRLDDAIELAQKRVDWNFKTAVPAFYPTKNTMSLLLPLDLTEDERPDVALVVELMESGAYIGQTILTMRMAYNNARLICRPDSDWLNTSLKLSDAETLA